MLKKNKKKQALKNHLAVLKREFKKIQKYEPGMVKEVLFDIA